MSGEPYRPSPRTIAVTPSESVSGLLLVPDRPTACLVLAHGAGAGMTHPFMATAATELADRGIATLRYQFPYMERGSRRTDSPKVAQAAVRTAVDEAARHVADLPLFAGGKSFGGRMTSQAQAVAPLPGVRGLAFLGFPLHPAGKPSDDRARHLFAVRIPMLFLQGTRDALADPRLIAEVASSLGDRAVLRMVGEADHSFHVLARSGRTDAQVTTEVFDALARWISQGCGRDEPDDA